MTFDHKAGIKLYDAGAKSYVSVDLSAATDRMPRLLQARIIERLYIQLGLDGVAIAKHWLGAISRSYSTRHSDFEKQVGALEYSVGQGMGLFSSWSSMAITHHFIVNQICGVPADSYVLVGDDLLIKNNLSAYHKYLEVMTDIGVVVNPSKTLVSAEPPFTIEFARNYIIAGRRVAPLPTGVLYAYLDRKVSATTVFWAFRDSIDFFRADYLFRELKIESELEVNECAYFLWREEIMSYGAVKTLIESLGHHLLFTEIQFADIKQICASQKGPTEVRMRFQFLETLLSQCTMRREQDLLKTPRLTEDFGALRFAAEEVEDYADVMAERVSNSGLVIYSQEFGTPIVSKREARLIEDYMDFTSSK